MLMRTNVPDALAERLGEPASAALVDMLDERMHACTEHVMTQCSERFERRVVEETSKVRVEMAQMRGDLRQEMHAGFGALRQEMAQLGGGLRQEMAQLGGELRQEVAQLGGELRQEMAQLGGSLRSEMAAGRFDLLKWAFVFWVGQLVSIVGIVALLLRGMSPR